MNVLKSIEKHMEKMVEGIFGRAFKSSVQPVELAHKLAKEMSDHKTVSVSRVYVPSEYEVYLSPGDYEQLSSFEGPLVEDLASYLVAYANRESWTLVATPRIALHSDDDLALGEFGIAAHMGAQGAPEPGVPVTPPPTGLVATPAAPPSTCRRPSSFSRRPPRRRGAVAAAPAAPVRRCWCAASASTASTGRPPCWAAAGSATSSSTTPTCRGATPRCAARPTATSWSTSSSTNGILVNGREVKRVALADGDRLQLGTTSLSFETRPC